MIKHLSLALGAALLIGTAGSTLAGEPVNFKVIQTLDSGSEGPELGRSYFTVGARKIAFRPPQNCQLSSGPESLSIYLSKGGLVGQITVTNSAFAPAKEFAAETQNYFDAAEASLPEGAEEVVSKGGNTSLYAVNEWKCQVFDWTYSFHAHQAHRQVAYINIDPEHQVQLTIVADADLWETTAATARRFMTSWFWFGELKTASR